MRNDNSNDEKSEELNDNLTSLQTLPCIKGTNRKNSKMNKNISNSNINMSIMNDGKKGLGSKKVTAELSDCSSHY